MHNFKGAAWKVWEGKLQRSGCHRGDSKRVKHSGPATQAGSSPTGQNHTHSPTAMVSSGAQDLGILGDLGISRPRMADWCPAPDPRPFPLGILDPNAPCTCPLCCPHEFVIRRPQVLRSHRSPTGIRVSCVPPDSSASCPHAPQAASRPMAARST